MLTRPSLFGLFAAGLFAIGAAQAADKPVTPAACQAMVDKADQPQSQRAVNRCGPWRKQHLAVLNKAAAQCHAKHGNDVDNPGACDTTDYAAQRFWEEVQELESSGNKP